MPQAMDVASYFLSLQDEDAGDLISNLKLQKLLYYAQGYWLAERGEPLFPERVECWKHGPVVPVVYEAFKAHGRNAIPVPTIQNSPIDKDVGQFLNDIYAAFGQFSAWKLAQMTHDEPPWKEAAPGGEISHAAMRRYFETQLENG